MIMNKPKVLIVDNHDSFTYNLVESCRKFDLFDLEVMYTEHVRRSHIMQSNGLIISPGPGLPQESMGLLKILSIAMGERPILGICLGMQALAKVTGDKLIQMSEPKHGYASTITRFDTQDLLYQKIESPLVVGRYHSWRIDHTSLSSTWIPTAMTDSEVLMSMRHHVLPIWAVQFHPESYITKQGDQLIHNFLSWVSTGAPHTV